MPRILVALLLFVYLGPIAGAAMAQSKEETEARNRALVQSAFQAWAAGTGSPFELLSDDATWTIVGRSAAAGTYPSREDFMHRVIAPFNARMQRGLRPTLRALYADGDTVVVFFDAEGVARDGKPYVNTYAWFFEMRADKVVKATAFFDSIGFDELWRRVSPTTSDAS